VQPGQPGVRQGYADKKGSRWNLGTGETGIPHLYRNVGGKGTGKGFLVKGQRGKEKVLEYFSADEFEEAKVFAKKTEERLAKIPVKTLHLSGKKLTVANKYAQYLFEKDYKTLDGKQRAQIQATMGRQGDKFRKKSQYDLPSTTNQERIKNAFPDVEFDFKKGQKYGVPNTLKNGKRNPAHSAVAHFIKNGYILPKQNVKNLPVSMQREIVSTFELPRGVEKWNFDVGRGGTRYGIPGTAGENQALYQRIKYFTKDPRNFKIAADYVAPEGWLLSQMYRAWDAGHESYKPIYDTINGKKIIVGFTDNQFGKGKTYFGLKKYTKKFNGTPMSEHPDFKNTKKFIDIANRAKLPPNKVIADLLIKGGIEDNRVTLNTLLNYMVNEKGVEQTKRALVLHHKGGAKITPTRDLQILNRAVNQNIQGIETKMRADPKNITPKNIQFLKDAGASITIDGKTYGGGPKTAIGGFRAQEKFVESSMRKWEPEEFNKFKKFTVQAFRNANIPCIKDAGGQCNSPEDYKKGFNQLTERAAAGDEVAGNKMNKFLKNMRKAKGPLKWTLYGLLAEIGFMVPFGAMDYAAGKSWKRILGNATDWGLGPMLGQSEQEEFEAALPEGSKAVEAQNIVDIGGQLDIFGTRARGPMVGMDRGRYEGAQTAAYNKLVDEYNLNYQPFVVQDTGDVPVFSESLYDRAHQEAEETRARIAAQEAQRIQEREERGILAQPNFMQQAQQRGYAGGGIAGIRRPNAIPPESGPMPQGGGLSSVFNRVKPW
jgi:hypothetical protein